MRIHVPRWTVASNSASRIAVPAGNPAPRFQPAKFGSSFAKNLVEWLKPSPRRLRGEAQSTLEANWHATRSAFWRSQALALSQTRGDTGSDRSSVPFVVSL